MEKKYTSRVDSFTECMLKSILDIVSPQETNEDDIFPPGQFGLHDFKLYRKDVRGDQ